MKHTPGPWFIRQRLWLGGSAFAEGPGIFAIEDQRSETVICDRRTEWPERADEMEANARLIAAAPELLEALLALVDASDSAGLICGPRLVNAARAAIAKATGSAP